MTQFYVSWLYAVFGWRMTAGKPVIYTVFRQGDPRLPGEVPGFTPFLPFSP
jgi:hypothetical protein